MKIINLIIGLLIITWGSLLLSITVHEETFKTLMYKVNGMLFMTLGILYLRKFAKWGKQ